MPETPSDSVDQNVPDALISFLKAIPDGRSAAACLIRSVSCLLAAVLGILSDCRSSCDLEAYAWHHRKALN
jgi:hypothetical protein